MTPHDVARLVFDYLSDEGLEETKKVFWKESRDLLSTHHDIAVNTSQKLPTIIHEYFLLIGNNKNGSPSDPQSLLQYLWKQFDVLVGQLKHTTIHNSGKDNPILKFKDQKARVRMLNKQNWLNIQQKSKYLPNSFHGVKSFVNNGIPNINNQSIGPYQPFNGQVYGSLKGNCTPAYRLLSGQNNSSLKSPNASTNGENSVQNPTCINSSHWSVQPHLAAEFVHMKPVAPPSSATRAPRQKQVTTGPQTTAVQSNVVSESVQELNSSQHLQTSNEHLSVRTSEQLKSPKRKSVPPKKRTDEIAPVTPSSPLSTKTPAVSSADVAYQDGLVGQPDIQSIVDKILGRPELPEKLAASINRAVEIDVPASQKTRMFTEAANNDAQTQSLLLDSSKVQNVMEMVQSDPIFEELFSSFDNFERMTESCEEPETQQTRPKETKNAMSISSSMNGDKCANEALDALLLLGGSPIRQSGLSTVTLNTPQKGNSSDVPNSPSVNLNGSSVPSERNNFLPVMQDQETLNLTELPSRPMISHVRQLNFAETDKTTGDDKKNPKNDSKGNGFESRALGQDKSCSSVEPATKESCTTDVFASGTGKPWMKNPTNVRDSPIKTALEDLAVIELFKIKAFEPVENEENFLKALDNVKRKSLVKNVDKGGRRGTIDQTVCAPSVDNDTATRNNDAFTEVSEQTTSLTEDCVERKQGFGDITSPTASNTPETDVSLPPVNQKATKRKSNTKKKSSQASKKTKLIPDNLDVDRFLSSLHYVQKEKPLKPN